MTINVKQINAKPTNIKKSFFKKFYNNDDSPPEIFNKTLYFAVFLFGILGCARGYDEGNVAGSVAQKSFIKFAGLKDPTKSESSLANLKSNIKSMVLLGSIGGALISMYLVDKFGRVRTLQILSVTWCIGAIIQITSFSVGQLYAGRLIEGIAVGQTVVVGPCYLAEISPKSIRGLSGCLFAGSVYFGSMLANFTNYGTSLHISPNSRNQWVIPTALKIVLAGLFFIGSFFTYESPRWLVKVDKIPRAITNLSKIRGLPEDHPYVLSEIQDVQEQLEVEAQETGSVSKFQAFKELLFVKSIRHRFLLGLACQFLGQWTFAGSITMYMPELSSLVGITGTKQIMFSGVLGVVKFVSAYLSAFFIIDFLGRRKALYTGIIIQFLATLYFAIFLAIVPNATEDDYVMTGSQKRAGVSALAMLFITGVGWALGWNSIQYLINSEMLPLRCRNIGTAAIMTFHFANQYGNSKALPSMLIALKPHGTFFFASGVLLLGLFFCWFFLPEVSGRSLESMEEMFNLPWYLIGRRGAQLCPDYSGINNVHVNSTTGVLEIKQEEQFVENASEVSSNDGVKKQDGLLEKTAEK